MKQSEFEERLSAYWKEHYAAYDPTGKDHETIMKEWREWAHDSSRQAQLSVRLLEYARDCRITF